MIEILGKVQDFFSPQGFASKQYVYDRKELKHEKAFQGRIGSLFDIFEDQECHYNHSQKWIFQGFNRTAACNLVISVSWLYSHA